MALSGGPDSVALTALASQWAKSHGVPFVALHVDHRLRDTSSHEAQQVGAWCESAGVPFEILTWTHPPLLTGLQNKARRARYDLLFEACHARGKTLLLTAHHQDDALETFFMRFEKASGLTGLAGIKEVRIQSGIHVGRPLLAVPKEALEAYVRARALPVLRDPSNHDPRFLRGRLRTTILQNLSTDAASGMAGALIRLRHADDALAHYTDQAFDQAATIHAEGYASFDTTCLESVPLEVRLRLYERLCQAVFPRPYPLSFKGLQQIDAKMAGPLLGLTVGGCLLRKRQKTLFVFREPAAVIPHTLTSTSPFLWDRRFLVDKIPKEAIDLKIRIDALGEKGVQQLAPTIPRQAAVVLPSLWKDDTLMQVPHLGFREGTLSLAHINFMPTRQTRKEKI